jgi:hypothetical protein
VVVPVERSVRSSAQVTEAALASLLAGPTEAERDLGYWSHFSAATAGRLNSVRVANDVAHADFRDFSQLIPNATSSAGSAALLAELDATLGQFGTAGITVYSFDGNVAAFYEWLQMVPPTKMVPGPADARAAALKFATTVIELENPADEGFRQLTPTTAEVDIYSWIRSDDVTARGGLTTVSLRRDVKAWTVTGARTSDIRVSSPSPGQAISSPVTLRGEARAWGGVVTVRIVQANGDKVTELGRGNVLGGGYEVVPFSGSIQYTKPDVPYGWAIFTSASGHNSETMASTTVPVVFARMTVPPQMLDLKVAPEKAITDGWISLQGSGSVTFVVRAKGADRVRFYANPTGSRHATDVIPLGQANRSGDEFTLTWQYLDQPLLAHLSVVLSGPGGTTEHLPFGLYHP